MKARVPATIVTGFLGAGKTTLLRHLLQNARGLRIAVIVNEFGALGIDGALLEGCGIEGCEPDQIIELSNGCLCCTVADEFLPAMEALLDRPNPPDHIVIETSGLALPKPLLKAFSWPAIRARMMAADIAALLTEVLGVDTPVTMVGNDIGMMVAYAFGSEFPHLVERLVLMEAVLPGTAAYDRAVGTSTLVGAPMWHFFFHNAGDALAAAIAVPDSVTESVRM